jgi:hypothetical protein
MASKAEIIADLEKGLAAARELPEGEGPADLTEGKVTGAIADTSMMPGGADGAPVSAVEPEPTASSGLAQVVGDLAPVEHVAETEGLDLLQKLKDGHTVKEVAGFLHGIESNTAVESIIKAIADVAQGVRI